MFRTLTYIAAPEHRNDLLRQAQRAHRAAEVERPQRFTFARSPAARRRRATAMLTGAAAAIAVAVPFHGRAVIPAAQQPPTRHPSTLNEVAQPAVLTKRARVTTSTLG
jgi:hypothetical protein